MTSAGVTSPAAGTPAVKALTNREVGPFVPSLPAVASFMCA